MRPASCIAACLAGLFLGGTTTSAQDRFAVLTQSTMADVSGLRIVTIRDNQLSACYTVFILELPAPPGSVAPAGADDATLLAVERVREAAERRDRQLTDLSARTEVPGPVDPLYSYDAATKRATYE